MQGIAQFAARSLFNVLPGCAHVPHLHDPDLLKISLAAMFDKHQ